MARCLVLGGNGFIGSHLIESLTRKGHQVKAFDRFGTADIKFEQTESIEVLAGDFLNRNDLNSALKDVEYVFHFISTTTPASAENDPLIDIETNIRMSVELFQECTAAGIKKVIFASTGGAIYGDTNSHEPISEDQIPLPVSPYAIGKLTIEHYLRYFEKKFGLKSVIYRISNPYGDRQSLASRQGVIPIFLQHISKNEPIIVLGDGSMIRDYVYIEDVANMVASSFETSQNSLYNLGSGQGVSLNELIEVIKRVTGQEIQIDHQPKPPTFVQSVVLDNSRFKNEFNLAPTISLEDGVRKTWDYVKGHPKPR